MTLGSVLRRSCSALLLLLAGCGNSGDAGGLLNNDPGTVDTPPLAITGPDSVSSGSSEAYKVTALDAVAEPIAGLTITLTTSLGTLSLASTDTTTDTTGELPFTLSATTTSSSGAVSPVSGTAYVTASATIAGEKVSVTKTVIMTPSVFTFTSPASGAKVALNTLQPLVFHWTSNSLAVSAPVTFAAKLGTLVDADGNAASTLTVNTDAGGYARFSVVSGTSGAETITATDAGGGRSASLALTYLGEAATFTTVASSPISASGGASTISATVKDASGNAVAGTTVTFAIASAPAAGTLSPLTATTGSTGIATAIYRANGGTGTATITVTVGSLTAQTVTITINS